MKLFKKLAVIIVIAAFAVIGSNVRTDVSCSCGTISFPFSILAEIFNANEKSTADVAYETNENISVGTAYAAEKKSNIKVTFIELGSVNCIPCRMMQPVMKQIEQKYGSQVKVVFHDVWTEKGQPYGQVYRIRAIPTQVFLDSNEKEYFRHEGYFPFEEVEKILKKGGVR